ncbi:MAG: tyrosine-type recombinase/integrase [bacterium]
MSRLTDGRWRVRVYATDTRTGRARETQRTFPAEWSEAAVLAEVARLKGELSTGKKARPTGRVKLKHCAEPWLEDAAARNKRSTAELYLDVLAKRVLPVLGEVYLDALGRREIQQWVRWAEAQRTVEGDKPYARDTVHGWWRVLTQFVRDVCADHDLPDPIVRVRPPQGRTGRTREMRTLTADELGRLVRAARERVPARYAEIYLLAFTGMRAGELFALSWDDVDETRGRIVIRRGVRHGTIDTPKTGAEREVGLTDEMARVLRAHRAWLVEREHPGLASGLVFPSNVGTPRGPESLHGPLLTAGEAAGVEVRVGPQVLRRTFNTLMVEQNVDRIVLRSQMGHCSEEMTERYAGVAVEAKRAAVEALEAQATR